MTNINLIPVKNEMTSELLDLEFAPLEPCESACEGCDSYRFTYIPAKTNCTADEATDAEGEQFCDGYAALCPRAEKAVSEKSELFDEVWWQNLEEIDPKLLAFAIHGNDGDLRDVVRVIWKELEL